MAEVVNKGQEVLKTPEFCTMKEKEYKRVIEYEVLDEDDGFCD